MMLSGSLLLLILAFQVDAKREKVTRLELRATDSVSNVDAERAEAGSPSVAAQTMADAAGSKVMWYGLAVTIVVTLVAAVAILCRRLFQQALPKTGEGTSALLPSQRGNREPVGGQVGPPLPEAQVMAGILPLFENHATKSPGAVSLTDVETGACVTYQQLQALSSCLAADLQRVELDDGDAAALLLGPSLGLVVAMLGCMQARVCWVALDLKSPGARLRQLLDRSGCVLGLAAEDWVVDTVAPVPVWLLNDKGQTTEKPKPRPRSLGTTGNCAIFFTSGSTGEPKPVMYSPSFLCHAALCAGSLCSADADSVYLIKSPAVWSVIVYEIFAPLTVGARAAVDARAQRDIVRLQRAVTEQRVTVLFTSAPVLQLLADEPLPSLRHAVNIGAGLPLETCRAVQSSFGQSLSIHNMYGCTEAPCLQWTYDASSSSVLPPGTMAPAGRPQAATEVYVLDTDLQPLPMGDSGEIWIAGYLSGGYLGDAKTTEARYVPSVSGKGLMYKTGDVGRWTRESGREGALILLVEGRGDRQLNINGVRVAPEEVEAVLAQAPGIREVALVVVGGSGKERTVAWAVGEQGKSEEALREAIHEQSLEQLPPHMRPSTLLFLSPQLPRLGNGKVDLVQLTRRAELEVPPEEGEEQLSTVDSLGRMKLVKRQALHENKVMSASRCLAACSLVLFHWYWVHFAGFTNYVEEDKVAEWMAQGPEWFRFLSSGLVGTSGWALSVFIAVSGFDDAREGHRSMALRNCVAASLYLMTYVLPFCYSFVLYDVFQSRGMGFTFWSASPRWYFLYYIICNLLHSFVFLPAREAAKKRLSPSATALPALLCLTGVTSFCWWTTRERDDLWRHSSFLNLCKDGEEGLREWPQWFLFSVKLLIVDFNPHRHCCQLIRVGDVWLLVQYSMAWWLGPPVVDLLRKGSLAKPLQCVGPLPWMAAFLGLCCSVAVRYSRCGPTAGTHCLHPSIFEEDAQFMQIVNSISAYCLFMALALASHHSWFPLSTLASWGNFSLGVYVFHYGFTTYSKHGSSMRFFTLYDRTTLLPPPEDVVAAVGSWPGSTLAKVAVLIIYPLLWTATFGRLFQTLLLGPLSLSQKLARRPPAPW